MNDGDNIGGKKWRESKKWRDGHEQLQKIALLGASISDIHKIFGLFDIAKKYMLSKYRIR